MEMATKLVREFDFREASVPEKMLVLKIDAADIEAGMQAAAERFLTIEPAEDGIRAGDIVFLTLSDGEEAGFSVGKGFYDEETERAVLGLRRGQEVQAKGQAAVIRAVKRRNIPALTDGAVASIGVEGVGTVEGYRQHLVDRAASRKRRERDHILKEFVSKQAAAQSEFTPVDREAEDYRLLYEGTLKQAKLFAEQEEDATERDILRRMLNQPKEAGEAEILAALAESCEYRAKLAALGRAYAEREGVVYTLEGVEAELRQMAEARGIPYEAVLAQTTPEEQLVHRYMEHYQDKIIQHYEKQYSVVVE